MYFLRYRKDYTHTCVVIIQFFSFLHLYVLESDTFESTSPQTFQIRDL